MQITPAAVAPADGTCTNNQNSISYTPTENGDSYAISFCLGGNTGTLNPGPKCLTPGGIIDVNCLGSGSAPSDFTCGTDVTYEGELYPTVLIGSQCWFAKNLNVGTRIDVITAQGNYSGGIQKYCLNNNEAFCDVYGGHYQWHMAVGKDQSCDAYDCNVGNQSDPCCAVTGDDICPTGWHMPTDDEWTVLSDYLSVDGQGGAGTDVGGKLKEAGTTHWPEENCGSSTCNSSGFTALPAGFCYTDGYSYGPSDAADFWSSSPDLLYNPRDSWIRGLEIEPDFIYSGGDRVYSFSVRCLQD